MGIPEIRVRQALKKAQETLLKRGVPVSGEALKKILSRLGDLTKPGMDLFRQGFRKSFNVDEHNRMLVEVEDDLDVLFEAFYDNALSSLRTVDREDLLLRRYLQEGKRANDILEFELLTINGATGYFLGAFDTFRDASKVNLASTTAEIDLGTESVRLPRNNSGGVRLKLNHLLGITSAPFRTEGSVISTRTIPGAPFSNCFDDLASSWQQEIISTSASGVRGYVTFPLSPDGTEERITSIYLDPLVRGSIGVEVFTTQDGKNFQKLSTPRPTSLGSSRLRVGGIELPATHIRIAFTKATPDRQEADGANVYFIGLKSIEVHRESFLTEGTLISSALTAEDVTLLSTIDKVSLSVEEELPSGTDIEYYVSGDGGSNYSQLCPINRPRDDLSKVIDFERLKPVPAFSNVITVTSPTVKSFGTATRKNGITFYSIYTLPETATFGGVQLYRGLDAWEIVNREGAPEQHYEADNYIVFTNEDNAQDLYVNVEGEVITNPPASVSGTSSRFRTLYPVIQEASFRMFAVAGSHAQRPDYQIGRVLLLPGGADNELAAGTSSGLAQRSTRLFFDRTSQSTTKPRVYVATGTDFPTNTKVLELSTALSTDFIRRLTSQSVKLVYTYDTVSVAHVFSILSIHPRTDVTLLVLDDPTDILRASGTSISCSVQSLDVTEDITRVDADGFTLDASVEVVGSDRLVVDYRRSLTADDVLFLDSIVIKNTIGGDVTYVEGRDYTVDPISKTIYRDPSGQIRSQESTTSVRASFRYSRRKIGLHQYRTFVTVPGRDRLDLDLPVLTAAEGEAAVILVNGRPVDLLTARKLPLEPGRHTVQVTSKPVRGASGTVDTTSLLYKIINLTDSSGEAVFTSRRYFERQEAFAGPMQELAFQRLVNSVRAGDHSFFAVDSNQIILNFDPTKVEDIVFLQPGSSTLLTRERFAVGYTTVPKSVPAISSVILKAVLKRGHDAPPESTPELFSYHLRMSN